MADSKFPVNLDREDKKLSKWHPEKWEVGPVTVYMCVGPNGIFAHGRKWACKTIHFGYRASLHHCKRLNKNN